MSDSLNSAGTYVASAALVTAIASGVYNHQQIKTVNNTLTEHGTYIAALVKKINELQNLNSGVKGFSEALGELKDTAVNLQRSQSEIYNEISTMQISIQKLVTQIQLDHTNLIEQGKALNHIIKSLESKNNEKLYHPQYKTINNFKQEQEQVSHFNPPQRQFQQPQQQFQQPQQQFQQPQQQFQQPQQQFHPSFQQRQQQQYQSQNTGRNVKINTPALINTDDELDMLRN